MAENTKQKVVDEIEQIPREKLPEIYDLIHHYRLGIEQRGANQSQILALAGGWSDMPEDEFSDFLDEITTRRSRAFQRRRANEARSA